MQTDEGLAGKRQVIRLIDNAPVIVDDEWALERDDVPGLAVPDSGIESGINGAIESDETSRRRVIVPVARYLAAAQTRPERSGLANGAGVWISPDADFEAYAHELRDVPLIAIDFPSFRDGRGLSIGFILRTRFGYRGELRAIGDVLRDQLENMRRCGFDSFSIRPGKSITDALKGFSEISVRYQGMAGDPRPLFRRRDDLPVTTVTD
jgi:uncharacterized protein (DUF934 family)